MSPMNDAETDAAAFGKAEGIVAPDTTVHNDALARFVGTSDTIERLEEVAIVHKRSVSTGVVSVRTVTEAFDEDVAAELSATKAKIERVPIDRIVATIPQTRIEGGITIVPVFEEVLVVERRIRLVEELHIRQETSSESVRLPVTVRRQRAVVERLLVSSPATIPSNED